MSSFDSNLYTDKPLSGGRDLSCHKARQSREVNPLVRRCAR